MRQTKQQIQARLDLLQADYTKLQIDNARLKEQVAFMQAQSNSGMLNTLAITVQRVAEVTTNLLQAVPSIDRIHRS